MVTLDADWVRQDSQLTPCVLQTQSASRVTVRHRMNVPDYLFLTNPAVPDIFPYGTIGSPKNSTKMMLIRHFKRYLRFHVQSQHSLWVLWLCKVIARWPDLVSSMTYLFIVMSQLLAASCCIYDITIGQQLFTFWNHREWWRDKIRIYIS